MKTCDWCRQKAHEWYQANRERALAKKPRTEARRRASRAWYERNRERAIASAKRSKTKHRQKNAQANRDAARQWRAANPEGVKAQKASRKHRMRQAGPLSTATVRAVLAEFPECAYCGRRGHRTIEHVIAVDAGGTNEPRNLVAACVSCNSSKGARPWRRWYRRQPFFDKARAARIEERLRSEAGSAPLPVASLTERRN